ncbi:unnamed protein product [Brassica rapa]|uniref:Small ribosomal subunit protein eS4 N-terminal domain-containing protein n=1 Tax=Brassica campestris TaxID=3711 RepID=A0A3P6AQU7_BRACM|nr:unnamed protein product [Brassica rapa]VDC96256.1 unnamed protein product [Brassica rapa]
MICDDLSYTHEGVPDRFKTIEYYGFTSSYQIQLYPYSFIFHSCSYSSPTQAAITKDLSLTVAEDLSTLCLVLYPTWLLWLVQFPLARSHNILNEKGSLMNAGRLCISFAKVSYFSKHMKRLNAPKHWMLDKLGVQTKGHLFPDKLLSSAWRRTRLLSSSS